MTLLVVLPVLGLTVLIWILHKFFHPRNFPRGPFPFPVVGVLPQLAYGGIQKNFAKWKIQFGSIFSVNMGSERIVLSDYNVIKEAYSMTEFSGRPYTPHFRETGGENRRGVLRAEGAHWEEQRGFALRYLRNYSLGKQEKVTGEYIVDLLAKFKQAAGQPMSLKSILNTAMTNLAIQLLMSHKFGLDDQKCQLISNHLNIATSAMQADVKPVPMTNFVLNLAPKWTRWTEFQTSVGFVKDLINEQINYHKHTFQEGNFRNFIDEFINEINQTKDPNSSFYKSADEENLRGAISSLLFAGTGVASATLEWAVFYLSRNPEIQEQFQSEIDRVIGRERPPSLKDKEKMPYVLATILETLRIAPVLPIGAAHRTLCETKFHGFTIPKHTTISANVYDVHHDKEIWGDPEVFRPQRFLTSVGTLLNSHPPLIPFGIGKRRCIAETMAKNNIFLFLVSLFQNFDIKSPLIYGENIGKVGDHWFIPPEFKVIFNQRHTN